MAHHSQPLDRQHKRGCDNGRMEQVASRLQPMGYSFAQLDHSEFVLDREYSIHTGSYCSYRAHSMVSNKVSYKVC